MGLTQTEEAIVLLWNNDIPSTNRTMYSDSLGDTFKEEIFGFRVSNLSD